MATSDKAVAFWLEQVAEGLGAGLNASDAIRLAKALPGGRSDWMAQSFEAGSSWRQVTTDCQGLFSEAEHAMIAAADRTGSLPEVLLSLAKARLERARAKRSLALSMAYPLGVLHFAAVALPVNYVMEGNLKAYGYAVGMILFPLWFLFFMAFGLGRFFPGFARAALGLLPLLRGFKRCRDGNVLCRVLATCYRVGMPPDRCWETAEQAVYDRFLKAACATARDGVAKGIPASAALESVSPKGRLDRLVALLRSGETSGRLPQNLDALADRFAGEARVKLRLVALVYPQLLMIPVFGYVGYRIVSFYSAYFKQIMDMGSF